MRPHRNPENRAQYQANFDWRVRQLTLHPDAREEDWSADSAFCLDEGELMLGYGGDGLADPFAPARLARARPRDDGMANNAGVLKRYGQLNLDKLEAGPDIPRDIKLPPFKIEYDTHEQIHQKLNGTIILIKNRPFVVSETAEIKPGKFVLVVYDNARDQKYVPYEDVADCRGIAPGYFNYRGVAYWTYRIPERQNSQGMHQRNMQCKPAGSDSITAARADFLLAALGMAQNVKFAPNLADLITGGANASIRLTNRVALHSTRKKGAPVGVEYCGRPLGLIVNDCCKVYDESDLTPSWLHKDVNQAGLVLTA
jgi:hypothetical protein